MGWWYYSMFAWSSLVKCLREGWFFIHEGSRYCSHQLSNLFCKVPKYEFGHGTCRHGPCRHKNSGKFDVSATRIQWKSFRTRIRSTISKSNYIKFCLLEQSWATGALTPLVFTGPPWSPRDGNCGCPKSWYAYMQTRCERCACAHGRVPKYIKTGYWPASDQQLITRSRSGQFFNVLFHKVTKFEFGHGTDRHGR